MFLQSKLVLPAILWVSLQASSSVSAQGKDEKSIKEETPALGTILKKKIATSSMSMDRSYHQLSDDEKAYLRSFYEDMPEEDEPPYPLNGTRAIHQKMSKAQQIVVAKGMLTIAVDVSSAGEPESVSIFETPDSDIARVAALALLEEKYKPAMCAGKPCRMQFLFKAEFKRIL